MPRKLPLAFIKRAMATKQAIEELKAEGKKVVIRSSAFQDRIRKIKSLMNKVK
jgi:hypothetical protein